MRIALFITCFNDLLFPDVGKAVVQLLNRLGHYFEGTSTLYPATLRRWTEQRELSDALVDLIGRLSELDDLDPLPLDGPDAFEARVSQLVADHVEMAKAKALDEMGDGRGAVRIAIRWLAPKLGSGS